MYCEFLRLRISVGQHLEYSSYSNFFNGDCNYQFHLFKFHCFVCRCFEGERHENFFGLRVSFQAVSALSPLGKFSMMLIPIKLSWHVVFFSNLAFFHFGRSSFFFRFFFDLLP